MSRSGALLRTLLIVVAFSLAPAAAYAIPITIIGTSTGAQSTATGTLTFNDATNTLTLTLTNTSPFDARITGIGFDIFEGNVNGFTGSNVAGFTFSDGDLGNVPQFNSAILDFGFLTGSNFTGGSPGSGLAPGGTLTFIVSGDAFGNGLTESQLAADLFVRFQQVGPTGAGSDVGTTTVPVPDSGSTLTLLGLAFVGFAAARRKFRV